MAYLVDKYDKSDSPLIPIDAQARATVNQRLYFDMGTLSNNMGELVYATFQKRYTPPEEVEKTTSALQLLNTFLDGHTYVVGDKITLADYAIASTVSPAPLIGIDLGEYPNVDRWLAKCKETLVGWEHNEAGLAILKQYL